MSLMSLQAPAPASPNSFQFKFKMNSIATVFVGLLLASLATFASTQGSIDYPCDPHAPDDDPQCTGAPHLVCNPLWNHFSQGSCRCVPGAFWHVEWLNECRMGARLPCSTTSGSIQCTPYSTCRAISPDPEDQDNTVCACDGGFHAQSTGSFCVAGHGRPCADANGQLAQCDTTLRLVCGGSDPVIKVCTCSPSYLWSETRGKCLATVESASSCSVNDDCVDNAVCSRNNFGIARCNCAPGFTKNADSTCSLAYGEACELNIDPNAAVTCNADQKLECSATNHTCTCADGRRLMYGVCVGVADHECENHGDCTGGTLCHVELGKCFCSQALYYIQLADRTCGRLGRAGYCRLGGSYEDCPAAEYLECVPIQGAPYGRCECSEGYEMDENGRCYSLAGADCSTGNQNCVENAACTQGTCTCLPGTSPTSNGHCLKTFNQVCDLNPGNRCNADQGLTCANASCGCPTGQEWSQALEHCVALVAGTCTPSTNYCTANATCNQFGFCECAPGYAQRSPDDRHCAPSHGTACDSATAPCNEYQFLTCPDTRECACEFPLHQLWDMARAQCVSVLGSRCGPLDEYDGRELQCIETSVCRKGSDLVYKCVCDEENGMEPDGQGKCRLKEDQGPDPTTTTTTTVPPTTTTSTSTTTLPTTTATTPTPAPTTSASTSTTTEPTTTSTTTTTTELPTTSTTEPTTTTTADNNEDAGSGARTFGAGAVGGAGGGGLGLMVTLSVLILLHDIV